MAEAPVCKKLRSMTTWEETCLMYHQNSQTKSNCPIWRISDLFVRRRRHKSTRPRTTTTTPAGPSSSRRSSAEGCSSKCETTTTTTTTTCDDDEPFYSFRLEHRVGGAFAKHEGEERILLFRSDRPGAIAKIIYSSTPPPTSQQRGNINSKAAASVEDDERRMAQAKIHVLDVKQTYRGFDLGGLLFTEAVAALKHRYMDEPLSENDDSEDDESGGEQDVDGADHVHTYEPSSIHCQLDAEEDIRRHNKLVGFYQQLGCSLKPSAKVIYLNNNDGETYRKVPMHISLRPHHRRRTLPTTTERADPFNPNNPSRHGHKGNHHNRFSVVARNVPFVPLALSEANQKRLHVSNEHFPTKWILFEHASSGHVELQTTKGQVLRTEPGGGCAIVSEEDDFEYSNAVRTVLVGEDYNKSVEEWSRYRLLKAPDVDSNQYEDDDEMMLDDNYAQDDLWMLLSCHGTFLSFDSHCHEFYGSETPTFWQVSRDAAFTLTFTTDSPSATRQRQQFWRTQTVEYVTSMRQRYFAFTLTSMTLREALDRAVTIPATTSGGCFELEQQPQQRTVSSSSSSLKSKQRLSLRTKCFRTAEFVREAGHPDWVQLLALAYGLGGIVKCMDDNTDNATVAAAAAGDNDRYDWTLPVETFVVGCLPPPPGVPDCTSLRNNKDYDDKRYNTTFGMYKHRIGLDHVLLAWTGPEYMACMLEHNCVDVPSEGLKLIRLAALKQWHTERQYFSLANEEDEDVRASVADFYELLRLAEDHIIHRGTASSGELSDQECEELWNRHYADIATKYNAHGSLCW